MNIVVSICKLNTSWTTGESYTCGRQIENNALVRPGDAKQQPCKGAVRVHHTKLCQAAVLDTHDIQKALTGIF